MADVKVSALSEATQSELTDSALALASVVDGNSSTGFASRKSTFAKLASYVLNTFSGLSLGGVTRTVKAAIDAIQTTVASHTTSIATINNSLANIGDTMSAYLPSTTSIPNGTATGVTSISLTAGTWVVIGKITYQSGTANTYRLVTLGTSAGGNQYGWTQFLGISGYNCSGINARIITLTATTTVHLSAQHNSGAAINVAGGANNTFIQAVRIA